MIANLGPYPEYKESGDSWLGEMPAHWSKCRIKTLLHEVDHRSDDGNGVLLSLTRSRGLISHCDMAEKAPSTRKLTGYKRYEPGQIVMNRMQAWNGMFGAGPIVGLVSPDYAVFKVSNNHESKFVLERLKSPDLIGQFVLESKGIGSGFNRLYTNRFGAIPITIPPIQEQISIVQYIDLATGLIDGVMRNKRKMVKLLNEQKLAIIHQTVTRGLDPTVNFKPSDIPWHDEIPEHWVEKPLKHWARINVHTLGETTNPLYTFQYIDIGTVEAGRLVRKPAQYQFANAPSRARRILTKGDVIVSTVRTYLRAIWFVDHEPTNLIASTGFTVLSPNSDVEPEYLSYIAQDTNFIDRVVANSVGIAYPAISESALSQLKIALPDSKEEQKRLVLHIKSQIQPYVAAISCLECEIDLLHECRTRLIADIVTGKLDVREAAARLPAEAVGSVDEVLDIDGLEDVAEFDEREVET